MIKNCVIAKCLVDFEHLPAFERPLSLSLLQSEKENSQIHAPSKH